MTFFKTLIFSTFTLLGVKAAERPNIVYILLDDAGYGDLSCYGQTKFETPNIDRLAAEGMKFTSHYSGSTVCAPSRAVLMTGKHTGRVAVRGNFSRKHNGEVPLKSSEVTLPEILQKAGYQTAAFGKWGLGPVGSEGGPENQGIDHFFGYNDQKAAHNYYPEFLWENDKKVPLEAGTYSHTAIFDKSLEWVRTHYEEPFFLYLPVTIPHASMHVPEKYAAPFRKKFPQFEDTVGTYSGPDVTNPAAMFAGMMTLMDEDVGRLVALLEELGVDKDTLVILSSDNGAHIEGGHMPDFFDSTGPFRGYKRSLTDGGIRVPMIAKWKGHVAADEETDLISAHWDILPTICEIVGADIPDGVTGLSMLPTLIGKGEQAKHDYLYWEFTNQTEKRALRFGDWKVVQNNLETLGKDAPFELYNIVEDQGEENDLSEKMPELIEKAEAYFEEAHVLNSDFPFPWEVE